MIQEESQGKQASSSEFTYKQWQSEERGRERFRWTERERERAGRTVTYICCIELFLAERYCITQNCMHLRLLPLTPDQNFQTTMDEIRIENTILPDVTLQITSK